MVNFYEYERVIFYFYRYMRCYCVNNRQIRRLNNKDNNNNGVIIFGSILLLFLTLALLSMLPK